MGQTDLQTTITHHTHLQEGPVAAHRCGAGSCQQKHVTRHVLPIYRDRNSMNGVVSSPLRSRCSPTAKKLACEGSPWGVVRGTVQGNTPDLFIHWFEPQWLSMPLPTFGHVVPAHMTDEVVTSAVSRECQAMCYTSGRDADHSLHPTHLERQALWYTSGRYTAQSLRPAHVAGTPFNLFIRHARYCHTMFVSLEDIVFV